MSTVDTIISRFGTQAVFAKLIGITQSAIANWKKRGIPERQFKNILAAAKNSNVAISADELIALPRPATSKKKKRRRA